MNTLSKLPILEGPKVKPQRQLQRQRGVTNLKGANSLGQQEFKRERPQQEPRPERPHLRELPGTKNMRLDSPPLPDVQLKKKKGKSPSIMADSLRKLKREKTSTRPKAQSTKAKAAEKKAITAEKRIAAENKDATNNCKDSFSILFPDFFSNEKEVEILDRIVFDFCHPKGTNAPEELCHNIATAFRRFCIIQAVQTLAPYAPDFTVDTLNELIEHLESPLIEYIQTVRSADTDDKNWNKAKIQNARDRFNLIVMGKAASMWPKEFMTHIDPEAKQQAALLDLLVGELKFTDRILNEGLFRSAPKAGSILRTLFAPFFSSSAEQLIDVIERHLADADLEQLEFAADAGGFPIESDAMTAFMTPLVRDLQETFIGLTFPDAVKPSLQLMFTLIEEMAPQEEKKSLDQLTKAEYTFALDDFLAHVTTAYDMPRLKEKAKLSAIKILYLRLVNASVMTAKGVEPSKAKQICPLGADAIGMMVNNLTSREKIHLTPPVNESIYQMTPVVQDYLTKQIIDIEGERKTAPWQRTLSKQEAIAMHNRKMIAGIAIPFTKLFPTFFGVEKGHEFVKSLSKLRQPNGPNAPEKKCTSEQITRELHGYFILKSAERLVPEVASLQQGDRDKLAKALEAPLSDYMELTAANQNNSLVTEAVLNTWNTTVSLWAVSMVQEQSDPSPGRSFATELMAIDLRFGQNAKPQQIFNDITLCSNSKDGDPKNFEDNPEKYNLATSFKDFFARVGNVTDALEYDDFRNLTKSYINKNMKDQTVPLMPETAGQDLLQLPVLVDRKLGMLMANEFIQTARNAPDNNTSEYTKFIIKLQGQAKEFLSWMPKDLEKMKFGASLFIDANYLKTLPETLTASVSALGSDMNKIAEEFEKPAGAYQALYRLARAALYSPDDLVKQLQAI